MNPRALQNSRAGFAASKHSQLGGYRDWSALIVSRSDPLAKTC